MSLILRIVHDLKKANHRVVAGLMLLLSVAILGGLFYSQKDAFFSRTWILDWRFIAIAFVIHLLALLSVSSVWGWIMNTLATPLPISAHIRNYIFSNLAKRIPGTIWYIAGRGYLYRQDNISLGMISVASSVELAITILSGIIVSLVFAFPDLVSSRSQGILIAIGAVLCLLLVHPRIIRWLFVKLNIKPEHELRYILILQWIGFYIFCWLLTGLLVYILANAIITVPVQDLPVFIGSWALSGVISASFFFFPSNLGVTEVSLSLLLSRIMPSSTAVVVAVLTRAAVTIFEIVWVLIFLTLFRPKARPTLASSKPQ
jgi:hypothetical protein